MPKRKGNSYGREHYLYWSLFLGKGSFGFMRNWQNNRIYQEGNRTMGEYTASKTRYQENDNTGFYRRCGRSGLKLSSLSLGFWHNFGTNDDYENMKQMCFAAFDHGITHFDLANNYGPVPGSAESNLGRILREEMSAYRDEPRQAMICGKDPTGTGEVKNI